MKPRLAIWFLFGSAFLPVAWSQEAPVQGGRVAARSFDLANPSIKQIVHDAAAAQSTLARAAEDATESDSSDTIRFVPAPKAQAAPVELRPFPQVRVPRVLSEILGAVVDNLAGVNETPGHESWNVNRSRDSLAAFRQLAKTPDDYPPSPVKPTL